MSQKLIPLAVIVSLLLAVPAAAQMMVVSASGPSSLSFPEGSTLPANRPFKLLVGDVLVVMDGSGSRIITGPRVVTAARMGQETQVRLGSLLKRWSATKTSRIAAVRGEKMVGDGPMGLWQINLARGGSYCVPIGKSLAFWHDPAQMVAQLVVARSGADNMRTLVWPANASQLAWPDAVAFADGDSFAVLRDDQPPVSVTLHRIDPAPTNLEQLISALVDRHCDIQLARLERTLDLDHRDQANP